MDSGRLFNGPVVLVIMDGIGLSPNTIGNAVRQARTDFLNYAATNYLNLTLEAAGEAVGLPAGIMGNSEVGHNTIGSGQIIQQGIAHINNAFISGQIWQSSAWLNAIKNTLTSRSTLHFAGIFSDGGVHSDISHLEQMIAKAYEQGLLAFESTLSLMVGMSSSIWTQIHQAPRNFLPAIPQCRLQNRFWRRPHGSGSWSLRERLANG